MAKLENNNNNNNSCSDFFNELLCVTFTATFTVDIECEVTGVECLGPCPPEDVNDIASSGRNKGCCGSK